MLRRWSQNVPKQRAFLADGELAYKLYGGCTAHASKGEERQRLRAEGVVDSRGDIKLPNDADNLELFKVAVELIQQEQVQNKQRSGAHFTGTGAEQHSGANRCSASSTFTVKKFHDLNESDDVEEESDEDEVQKLVINVEQKMSCRDKERRKSRRKLKSKLKNDISIISTAMEVKGRKMMLIMKHVNFTVQGDRSTETRTK